MSRRMRREGCKVKIGYGAGAGGGSKGRPRRQQRRPGAHTLGDQLEGGSLAAQMSLAPAKPVFYVSCFTAMPMPRPRASVWAFSSES
jgi:hypothetical protein